MKIFAVGMNYAEHNKELDGALYKTEAPVIFTKADSALLTRGKPFFVPDHLGRIDYEAELVVRICRLGKSIPVRFAHRYYDAVTVGIDFTARDLQRQARAKGMPWTICKGFDGSAAIGEWVTLEDGELKVEGEGAFAEQSGRAAAAPQHSEQRRKRMGGGRAGRKVDGLHFRLDKNGETVQQGHAADMLYGVDELISYISQFFTLKTGDMLYTGTPAGVGPVSIGDHLEGWLEDRKVLDMNCR